MNIKTIIPGLLIVLFLGHLFFRLYQYKDSYTEKYNAEYWKDRYLKSQWIVPNSKNSIGDDGLYAYVGWEYITGRDPTTLNAEMPPFGKYLVGLSEVVFKNQNIFALISGIFVLGAFYFLNLSIFKNKFLSFIPVVLFSFEPLFYTQLRAPFLDLIYLGLLLTVFSFLIRKQYFLSAIFLGLMAATKASSSTFALVIFSSLLYLLLSKQYSEVKKYIFSIPLALLSFLLVYIRFFTSGHNILEFLSVQKWALGFYSSGARGQIIDPWQMITTGGMHAWWGEDIRISEWHLGWPLLLILSFACSFIFIKKGKFKHELFLIIIWLVVYFIFLSFVPVWSRYLLLVLPFMYNLAIWLFSKRLLSWLR